MSVIPAHGRLKQEDCEANLDYIVRPCLKKQKAKFTCIRDCSHEKYFIDKNETKKAKPK
jgi:hypothetical protein